MKHENTVNRIKSAELTRAELQTIRGHAQIKYDNGDEEARLVLQALDSAVAKDSGIIFMGFCPNGEIANRLDMQWKQNGICTFDYDESIDQMNLFRSICVDDFIVLKKSEDFGRTMSLHGHGRVIGRNTGEDGRRFLGMNWSPAVAFPSNVPLMGCQSTVNLRDMQTVEGAMPHEFFDWANLPRTTVT